MKVATAPVLRLTSTLSIVAVVASASLGCEEEDSALARRNADIEAIRAIGACFTNGIDTLTVDVEAGVARWNECFSADHSFEFTGEIPGTGVVATVVCPGDRCPAPAPQMGAGPRAAFAAGVFMESGYVSTQHVLNNVVVTVDGDTGTLESDLIAYHFLDDGSVDVFNGRWGTDVRRIDGVWRSTHERAEQRSFVNVAGGALGSGSAVHADALRALAKCYTTGIDQIGAADVEVGTNTWRDCYIEDFTWDFDFGPFGALECPGAMCPSTEGVDTRAGFAAGTFASQGYIATQHLLTNIELDVDLATAMGRIQADLTAFHYLPSGEIDLFSGRLELTAVRSDGTWRVSHESGDFTSFLRLMSEPVPTP